ncbi:Formation of crista junctions protein 1 [Lobulomyces angularis]|nr:Formation of crista junctions protein 1 [Lobulomyces angularis]
MLRSTRFLSSSTNKPQPYLKKFLFTSLSLTAVAYSSAAFYASIDQDFNNNYFKDTPFSKETLEFINYLKKRNLNEIVLDAGENLDKVKGKVLEISEEVKNQTSTVQNGLKDSLKKGQDLYEDGVKVYHDLEAKAKDNLEHAKDYYEGAKNIISGGVTTVSETVESIKKAMGVESKEDERIKELLRAKEIDDAKTAATAKLKTGKPDDAKSTLTTNSLKSEKLDNTKSLNEKKSHEAAISLPNAEKKRPLEQENIAVINKDGKKNSKFENIYQEADNKNDFNSLPGVVIPSISPVIVEFPLNTTPEVVPKVGAAVNVEEILSESQHHRDLEAHKKLLNKSTTITKIQDTLKNLYSNLNEISSKSTLANEDKVLISLAKISVNESLQNLSKHEEEEFQTIKLTIEKQNAIFEGQKKKLEEEHQNDIKKLELNMGEKFNNEKFILLGELKAKHDEDEVKLLAQQALFFADELELKLNEQKSSLEKECKLRLKNAIEHERDERFQRLDLLELKLKLLEKSTFEDVELLERLENLRIFRIYLKKLKKNFETKNFEEELANLKKLSLKQSKFVQVILQSLKPEADGSSYLNKNEIQQKFSKVTKELKKIQFIPDNNLGPFTYFFSSLLSKFSFSREPNLFLPGTDMESVLGRARYYFEKEDFDGVCRELNQLKGFKGEVCKDFLNGLRNYLIFTQAFEVLETHLELSDLNLV